MIEKAEQYSSKTFIQPFSATEALTGNTFELTNIIVQVEGKQKPALLLCAHWDTRVFADRDSKIENRKTAISGANDGASGIAVLLEIMRIVSENPPPRSLLFIFFDGEDMGRSSQPDEFALGSRFWSENPMPEIPSEAILLDMVGDSDLEFLVEYYSEQNSPGFRKYLWDIAESLDLEAFKELPGPAVADDHLNLIKIGINAIDIIDFDYPYWHTVGDTPDKCSPESLGQVGKLILAFIYGID